MNQGFSLRDPRKVRIEAFGQEAAICLQGDHLELIPDAYVVAYSTGSTAEYKTQDFPIPTGHGKLLLTLEELQPSSYTLRVGSVFGTDTVWSDDVTVSTLCPPHEGITATENDGELKITWGICPCASSYLVELGADKTEQLEEISITVATPPSGTIISVKCITSSGVKKNSSRSTTYWIKRPLESYIESEPKRVRCDTPGIDDDDGISCDGLLDNSFSNDDCDSVCEVQGDSVPPTKEESQHVDRVIDVEGDSENVEVPSTTEESQHDERVVNAVGDSDPVPSIKEEPQPNLENTNQRYPVRNVTAILIDDDEEQEEFSDDDVVEPPTFHDGTVETYRTHTEALSEHPELWNSWYSSGLDYARKILLRKVIARKIDDEEHPCFGQYGVFAQRDLKAKTPICDYAGDLVAVKKSDDKYVNNPFLFNYAEDEHYYYQVDASKRGNLSKYVNDFKGIDIEPNCEFSKYSDKITGETRIGLRTITELSKGEELLVSYGYEYWDVFENQEQ